MLLCPASIYTCISLARGVISTANCARKMSEGTATSAPAPPTPSSLPFSQSRRLLLLLFSYSSSFFSMQLTFSIHRHPTAESQVTIVLYGVGRRHFTVIIIKRFCLWLHTVGMKTRQEYRKKGAWFMTLGRGNLLGVLCRTYGTGRHNSIKKAI